MGYQKKVKCSMEESSEEGTGRKIKVVKAGHCSAGKGGAIVMGSRFQNHLGGEKQERPDLKEHVAPGPLPNAKLTVLVRREKYPSRNG